MSQKSDDESLKYDVTKSISPALQGASYLCGKSKEEFKVMDSGNRQQFPSGMQRDTTDGKIDWTLIADGPMVRRWAEHMTKGAKKYSKRNWMKANGQAELDRAKESAFRHFMSWYHNETDEDHASGVYFNINLAEYTKEKLNGKSK